jgi:hypothetical protein
VRRAESVLRDCLREFFIAGAVHAISGRLPLAVYIGRVALAVVVKIGATRHTAMMVVLIMKTNDRLEERPSRRPLLLDVANAIVAARGLTVSALVPAGVILPDIFCRVLPAALRAKVALYPTVAEAGAVPGVAPEVPDRTVEISTIEGVQAAMLGLGMIL